MLPANRRAHTEKMLHRALRRQRQANLLVKKWTALRDSLGPNKDRSAIPLLWVEPTPEDGEGTLAPATLPLPFEPGTDASLEDEV